MRTATILILLTCYVGRLWAYDPATALQSAANAYNNGDYQQAVQRYRAVLDSGLFSAGVYYNLGNACFKAGELACARLNYERALRLDPRDAAIRTNLEALKSSLPDQFAEVQPFAPVAWWRAFATLLPVDGWSGLLLLADWLLCALLWLKWKKRWPWPVNSWRLALTMTASVLVLAALLLYTRHTMLNDDSEAVVLVQEVALKSAPDAFGSELLRLHAGTKLRILDKIGDQCKVELPNGDTGWLPTQSIERI